jgi:hypothetical protein
MRTTFFKACLLLGAFHYSLTAVNAAAAMVVARDCDPVPVTERVELLGGDAPVFSGYLKHQTEAVVMQASIHDLCELIGKSTGTVAATRKSERVEIEKRITQLQDKIAQKGIKRTAAEKAAELAKIEELIEEANANIAIVRQGGEGVTQEQTDANVAKYQADLEIYKWQKELLSTPAARYDIELSKLLTRRTLLIESEAAGAENLEEQLFRRAALKLKTVYDLRPGRGGTDLITNGKAHLELVNRRYSMGATASSDFADFERGNTVSMGIDIPEILHSMGVDPRLVNGIVREEGKRFYDEMLSYMPLLMQLLMGIETPSVQFRRSDLPMPHNVLRVGGRLSSLNGSTPQLFRSLCLYGMAHSLRV